mgnify:CR=1 FL=1
MEWIGNAAAGAGLGFVGHGLREGLRLVAGLIGSEVLRRLAGSTPVTALIFAALAQGWLTYRLRRGRLDARGYGLGTARNLGSTVGSVLGAVVAAVLLSVVPVFGTVVGIVVGSFIGSLVGGWGLRSILARAWEPDP